MDCIYLPWPKVLEPKITTNWNFNYYSKVFNSWIYGHFCLSSLGHLNAHKSVNYFIYFIFKLNLHTKNNLQKKILILGWDLTVDLESNWLTKICFPTQFFHSKISRVIMNALVHSSLNVLLYCITILYFSLRIFLFLTLYLYFLLCICCWIWYFMCFKGQANNGYQKLA